MNRQLPGAVARAVTALSFGLLSVAVLHETTSAQDRLKTHAGLRAVPEDERATERCRALWCDERDMERRQRQRRIRARRQALSLRRRHARRDRPRRGRRHGGGRRPRRARRRPGRDGHRARTPGGVGRRARRQAQSLLSRPQPVGERSRRRQRVRASRPTATTRTGSSTARRAGCTGRSSDRRARSGGRPTAARSPTTASTRKQVLDYNLQLDQTKIQSTNDVEAYPKAGAANPDRRPLGLRRRREEEHARSTSAAASRSTTPSSATTSTACRGRPTAASCSSTAPIAGRTSWSSPPRIPRPARRGSSSAKSGRRAGWTTGRRCSS